MRSFFVFVLLFSLCSLSLQAGLDVDKLKFDSDIKTILNTAIGLEAKGLYLKHKPDEVLELNILVQLPDGSVDNHFSNRLVLSDASTDEYHLWFTVTELDELLGRNQPFALGIKLVEPGNSQSVFSKRKSFNLDSKTTTIQTMMSNSDDLYHQTWPQKHWLRIVEYTRKIDFTNDNQDYREFKVQIWARSVARTETMGKTFVEMDKALSEKELNHANFPPALPEDINSPQPGKKMARPIWEGMETSVSLFLLVVLMLIVYLLIRRSDKRARKVSGSNGNWRGGQY